MRWNWGEMNLWAMATLTPVPVLSQTLGEKFKTHSFFLESPRAATAALTAFSNGWFHTSDRRYVYRENHTSHKVRAYRNLSRSLSEAKLFSLSKPEDISECSSSQPPNHSLRAGWTRASICPFPRPSSERSSQGSGAYRMKRNVQSRDMWQRLETLLVVTTGKTSAATCTGQRL